MLRGSGRRGDRALTARGRLGAPGAVTLDELLLRRRGLSSHLLVPCTDQPSALRAPKYSQSARAGTM
ncbi:hypothetical protein NDU88_007373 [Pleurodeles waltl]|uniref:Uncharacterized protein n=1 Tax=Pleurodeles waltl TaxID=8319 RepID=A0AAV7NT42_PLEWA|nr:hypothetical protein NDU88_007373 [Pleurodeles waltl]